VFYAKDLILPNVKGRADYRKQVLLLKEAGAWPIFMDEGDRPNHSSTSRVRAFGGCSSLSCLGPDSGNERIWLNGPRPVLSVPGGRKKTRWTGEQIGP